MEKGFDEFKEFLNKNVTAEDIIDQPETAFLCKAGFDTIEGLIMQIKDNSRYMDRIYEKLEQEEREIYELKEHLKEANRQLESIRKSKGS